MDSVAETSDEFMERYFSGDEFSVDEIRAALRFNIDDCSIVPVEMGSACLLYTSYLRPYPGRLLRFRPG